MVTYNEQLDVLVACAREAGHVQACLSKTLSHRDDEKGSRREALTKQARIYRAQLKVAEHNLKSALVAARKVQP